MLKGEYEVTGQIYKSGEWPEKVFLGMKWVENGRFGLKIGAIEAKWQCGPFGPVFEVKNGLPRPVFRHGPARALPKPSILDPFHPQKDLFRTLPALVNLASNLIFPLEEGSPKT